MLRIVGGRLWENEKDPYRHAAMALLLGDETPQSANYNNWGSFYKGIRKANIVLTRISECKDLSDMERRDYTGRTYFLRGYFYFSLLRQYGPVPIVPDKPFDADTPSDEASIERSTYDECIDYICSDMERLRNSSRIPVHNNSSILQAKVQH